jgi:hypothetical protein
LQACFLKALEKDRLRSMPNSYLPAAPVPRKGALLLGDALNMRYVLVLNEAPMVLIEMAALPTLGLRAYCHLSVLVSYHSLVPLLSHLCSPRI